VRLSDKGAELHKTIESMLKRHEEKLKGTDLTNDRLTQLNLTLHLMERFWASQTNFSGLSSLDEDFE
jgi:hypothetical protein